MTEANGYDLRGAGDSMRVNLQAILAGTGPEHTLQDVVQWDRGPRWVLASKISGLVLARGRPDGSPWPGVVTVQRPALDLLARVSLGALDRDPGAVMVVIEDLRTRGVLGPREDYESATDQLTNDVLVWAPQEGAEDPQPEPPDPAETFADHPTTLGEKRAERSQRGQDWRPRDLLVKLLRDHDSGEVVLTDLVVSFRADDGVSGFWNSCADRTTAVGLAAQAMTSLSIEVIP